MPNAREKLIELLINSPGLETLFGREEEFAENADWLIANGVTVQQWIPVTERLPEPGDVVLVCGSRGGIYTAEFRMFGDFGEEYPHWHKLNSKNHHCEPTHWMPLPEPPKGE